MLQSPHERRKARGAESLRTATPAPPNDGLESARPHPSWRSRRSAAAATSRASSSRASAPSRRWSGSCRRRTSPAPPPARLTRRSSGSLVKRGLSGIQLVVADAHAGLKQPIGQGLGCPWQRCTVHFLRETRGHVRKDQQGLVAALSRPIFARGGGGGPAGLLRFSPPTTGAPLDESARAGQLALEACESVSALTGITASLLDSSSVTPARLVRLAHPTAGALVLRPPSLVVHRTVITAVTTMGLVSSSFRVLSKSYAWRSFGTHDSLTR